VYTETAILYTNSEKEKYEKYEKYEEKKNRI